MVGVACSGKEQAVVKTNSPSPTPTLPPPAAPSGAKTEIFHGTGRVTATNPKYPSVEMDHDEIVGLMPAMRMEFFVKDEAMLKDLKPGDKIEFTLRNGVG